MRAVLLLRLPLPAATVLPLERDSWAGRPNLIQNCSSTCTVVVLVAFDRCGRRGKKRKGFIGKPIEGKWLGPPSYLQM